MSEPTESNTPYPPRFWWLKRLCLLAVFIVAAVIALRLWWGHVARARLQAAVDAIHARGEPILIEDFAEPAIADRNNAAFYWKQAARAVVAGQADNLNWDWNQYISQDTLAIIRPHLAANRAALQWARQARDQSQTVWGTALRSPVFLVLLPDLNWQRSVANLLAINAFSLHHDQRDAEAIESIRDCLSQSNALTHEGPFIVTHLVAVGICARASSDAFGIAPDLLINSTSTATRPSGPASREQVMSLIAELLNDRDIRDSGIRAMYGERMGEYDQATQHASTVFFPANSGAYAAITEFFQPMIDLDAVKLQKYMTEMSVSMTAADYQTAKAHLPARFANLPASITRWITRAMSNMLESDLGRFELVHFRMISDRRAAAIALAVRLWQADHHGDYPAALSDLVPAYLPSIPLDPFAADGSAFRYLPKSANGPAIYSVGENGIDDGGSDKLMVPPNHFASHVYSRYERADYIYDLQRPAAATQPSDETDDDDGNK